MRKALWNRFFLAVLILSAAQSAWSEELKEINARGNDKYLKKTLLTLQEGKTVIFHSGVQRGGRMRRMTRIIAYFCDWEKPVFLASGEDGSSMTCVFKINESIEDFFK